MSSPRPPLGADELSRGVSRTEAVGDAANQPLRICQIVPYALDENGGVKHHASQLARALRGAGHQVTVVGPSLRPRDEDGVLGFPGVVNLVSNGSANRIGLFASPRAVGRFFRSARFDVLHVHEPEVPALGLWALLSSPGSARVASFHSFSERPRRTLGLLAAAFSAAQAPSFHAATAVSEVARSYARTFWPANPRIVPNGVSLETFSPPTGQRRPGPTRLLFVGRLGDERKGFSTLLAAYQAVRAWRLDVVLDVVGELGGASPPPAIPGLTYHGAVPLEALAERYRACDVFVAPSTGQESFGIVLLEAMASGRPIICSDIAGYRPTVVRSGVQLVTPQDARALAHAIAELAARPERWPVMGQANLARSREFSWERVARLTHAVYLDALAARDARPLPRRGRRVGSKRSDSAGSSVHGGPRAAG